MGELEPQSVPSERVKCWKCGTWFMMPATASRASCPECGSQVSLHRLKMPAMPTSTGKGIAQAEVIRLPVEGEDPPSGRPDPIMGRSLEMSVLENAGASKVPPRGGPPETRPHGAEAGRHRMFMEADPRREGEGRRLELPQGISFKTLLLSVGLATLLLLVLIFAIES